jgi:uncharacterized protein YndB with AHSA1/START domain
LVFKVTFKNKSIFFQGRLIMADMLHQVYIDAPPQRVYDAISTGEGPKSWWTADTEAETRVGSIAVFGFFKRTTVFRMEIDELTPAKRIRWRCVDGPDEWKGTEISFELKENPEGGTVLDFRHGGWRSRDGAYPLCNTTWGALMIRLKDYVEGKNPGPLFKG